MTREILFRGKRVDNGEWIRGDLITTPFIRNTTQQNIIYILDITKADYDCFEDLVEDNGIFEVVPETVCQYTGLLGKNGRKIFEGDIVKTSQYGIDDGNGHNYAGFDTFSVEFSDGGFCLKNKWRRFDLRPQRDFEVIGNIFDNPELIGE